MAMHDMSTPLPPLPPPPRTTPHSFNIATVRYDTIYLCIGLSRAPGANQTTTTPNQVKVKYVPKEKLRRRYWPKYEWAFGWFTHGKMGEHTYMRGDLRIVIRTHRTHKNLHILVFLLSIFGPDSCVPPK